MMEYIEFGQWIVAIEDDGLARLECRQGEGDGAPNVLAIGLDAVDLGALAYVVNVACRLPGPRQGDAVGDDLDLHDLRQLANRLDDLALGLEHLADGDNVNHAIAIIEEAKATLDSGLQALLHKVKGGMVKKLESQ